MLKRAAVAQLTFCIGLALSGQNQNDRWLFGELGGIDFTVAPPGFTNLPVGSGVFAPEVSATYCDPTTGAVRLFSNGLEVVGPDGNSLPGPGPSLGSSSATQGVFVPLPGNNDLVYLFLVDASAGIGPDANGFGGLSYSIIDLTLNAGQGGFVATDVQLVTAVTEKLTVVKGCTGEDHWIICHGWNSNTFFSYHLTENGLDPLPVISTAGVVHQSSAGPFPTSEAIGQMKASRDRSKLALVVGRGLQRVELFDFDNSSGVVGPLIFSDADLTQLNSGDQSLYGVEFSPDGSKLYASVRTEQTPFVYQYDISSGVQTTIASSRTLVFNQPNAPGYGGLQLGPDGRIYVAKFGNTLDVITTPNAPGAACGYIENAAPLNPLATCVLGLPQLLDLDVPVPETASFTYDECGVSTTMVFVDEPWPLPIAAFLWDFDDPASGAGNTSSLRDAQHTFTAPGSYDVELVVFYGCTSDTLVQTVTVNSALPIIPPIPSTSVCVGGTVTITAEPQGATSLLWTTGATTPSISVDLPGSYILTATNTCGSTNALATVLQGGAQVPPLPLLQFICLGDSITLSAEAPDADSYLWSTSETTPSITVSDFGIYAVTVSNTCGTITIQTTVTGQPDPFIFGTFEASFCAGDEFELAPTFFNEESILWSTGETTPTITVDQPGVFTVTATNTCGSVSQSFTVNDNASAPVIDEILPLSLCAGQSSSLTAVVTGGGAILWSTGETTATISVNAPGVYSVTATSSCGSASQSTEVVIDGVAPELQPLPSVSLCPGEETTLTATVSGGAQLLWSTGETSESITVSDGGVYIVNATNGCGSSSQSAEVFIDPEAPAIGPVEDIVLCPGASVLLAPEIIGDATVLWSTGDSAPLLTVSTPGVYIVNASNPCGNVSESITVIEGDAAPVLVPLTDEELCVGQQITLTAQVIGNADVGWNTGATSASITVGTAGTYSVVASNECGVAEAESVVSFQQGPPVIQPILGPPLCAGADVVLTAEVEDADELLWNTGETVESIIVSQPGTYQVTATNACGSVAEGVVFTAIIPLPAIAALDDVTICPGTTAVLNAQASDAASFTWSTGESTSSIEVGNAGVYAITVENACGSATEDVVVSFAEAAPALSDLSDIIICPGEIALLSVVVVGNASLVWNTGATTSTIEVSDGGVYTVTASNSCGSASRTAVVERSSACVDDDELVYLPNAFTPDGDGINDAFGAVSGSVLASFELLIFDRWGGLVWSANEVTDAWDGLVNGEPARDGVYVTRMAYRTEERKSRVILGHVVLLR